MKGSATTLGAATILNAVASWKGSAFGIDIRTTAEVELFEPENGPSSALPSCGPDRKKAGRIAGDVPGIDTTLITRCVELVLRQFGYDWSGIVRTRSEIPVASGLKSSSAAANAAVLATLDAIGKRIDPLEATRIGVHAALDCGVTITGAFDDACASMLGGVVVTDNHEMLLLRREEISYDVLLLVPDERLFSKDTDVRRSRMLASVADVAFDLAMHGDYIRAMTLNGLIYCSALKRPVEPIFSALEAGALCASLSGTGPSYAALVTSDNLQNVESAWREIGGRVIRTEINNTGAIQGKGVF